MRAHPWFKLMLMVLISGDAFAEKAMNACIIEAVASAGDDTSAVAVREKCRTLESGVKIPERLVKEQLTESNAFVITPHRQNYVLPFTHNARPNESPWIEQQAFPGVDSTVQHKEAKLQLSLKVPLVEQDLLFDNDGLYFGFTLKSFWQVFNNALSKPFRETNYRPELFYQAPIAYSEWGGTIFSRVGIEHESNGRSQYLSRSWNRVYVGLGFLRDRWAIYVQPWYRISEDKKPDDGDPNTPPAAGGDDNPDIDDYLGDYEILAVYNEGKYEYSAMLRQNFSTGNGAVELGFSFPLWGRMKGYLQYYDGYGESLLDYDHRVQRIGLGFLLTELL